MRLCYQYDIVEAEGEKFVEFASFPEIICTVSDDEIKSGEADDIALDALLNALQVRMNYSDELPPPDEVSIGQEKEVCIISPLISGKVILYRQFQEMGVTRAEFARRAGCSSATAVNRLFDLSHASRFELLTEAFDALGLILEPDFKLRKRA